MNTGIQDAVNLAWKLALVVQGRSPASLLDSYDPEREQVVKGVLQLSDLITRLGTLRNPVAAELRDRLIPLVVGQEVIQQRAVRRVAELSIGYRHSPIVSEHGIGRLGGGPPAGDRAPDAGPLLQAGASTSLYALLHEPKHTLLLIAGAEPEGGVSARLEQLAASVQERHGAVVTTRLIAPGDSPPADAGAGWILDPTLTLHQRYAAGHESLYLIRPDGYIAYRSRPAGAVALDGYLKQIFT
jgi:hypothetical protein